MFKVFFINFGYYSDNESIDLESAKKVARQAGFQSVIRDPHGKTVASYCPLSGITTLTSST